MTLVVYLHPASPGVCQTFLVLMNTLPHAEKAAYLFNCTCDFCTDLVFSLRPFNVF